MWKAMLFCVLCLLMSGAVALAGDADTPQEGSATANEAETTVHDPGELDNESLARRAYQLNMEADFLGARTHAFELFARTDSDVESCLLLAYAFRGAGEHYASIAYSTLALNSGGLRSQTIDAYVGRAACYFELGMNDRAKADLKSAEDVAVDFLTDQPKDPLAYYQLACISSVRSQLGTGEDEVTQRELALSYIRIAVKFGYDNKNHMKNDLDFVPLLALKAFRDICK